MPYLSTSRPTAQRNPAAYRCSRLPVATRVCRGSVADARAKLPDRIRFEIFKRDHFACQYCGRKAPDVVLNCDHIKPVAAGGSDDLLNLVTSCRDCNSGKSDRRLDDASAVEKARAQAESLEERREQIRMMAEWQVELAKLNPEMDAVAAVLAVHGLDLDAAGKREARQIVRRYGLKITLAAVAAACDQAGNPTWGYIAAIAKTKRDDEQDPERAQIARVFNAIVRGMERSRYYYECRDIVFRWHADGFPAMQMLRSQQSEACSWYRFRSALQTIDNEVRK